MIFSKREVIELSGGKKYIVVEALKEKGTWYYYLCEVNNEETKVKSNFKIITTINENGKLFVKTVSDEHAIYLEKKFKTKLNID